MRSAARAFADALWRAAGEPARAEAVCQELQAVAEGLAMVPRARELLAYPAVGREAAERLLEAIAARCSPLAAQFIRHVASRGQIRQLPGIAQALRERLEEARGILRGELYSAHPLPPEAVQAIGRAMGARLGSRVELVAVVVPELIGGFRVRVGDRILDASLASRLVRLRRRLAAAG